MSIANSVAPSTTEKISRKDVVKMAFIIHVLSECSKIKPFIILWLEIAWSPERQVEIARIPFQSFKEPRAELWAGSDNEA